MRALPLIAASLAAALTLASPAMAALKRTRAPFIADASAIGQADDSTLPLEDEDEVEVRPEDGEGENETSRLREELRLMREGIDRLEKMI